MGACNKCGREIDYVGPCVSCCSANVRAERDEAVNPATTAARLRELAAEHPFEVARNPALALLALEDPGAYEEIREWFARHGVEVP